MEDWKHSLHYKHSQTKKHLRRNKFKIRNCMKLLLQLNIIAKNLGILTVVWERSKISKLGNQLAQAVLRLLVQKFMERKLGHTLNSLRWFQVLLKTPFIAHKSSMTNYSLKSPLVLVWVFTLFNWLTQMDVFHHSLVREKSTLTLKFFQEKSAHSAFSTSKKTMSRLWWCSIQTKIHSPNSSVRVERVQLKIWSLLKIKQWLESLAIKTRIRT